MRADRFLGQGWGFPLGVDQTGRLPFAQGAGKIQNSIRLILDTEPGERIMRPSFGCGLRRYLMQPNTVTTRALVQRDVEFSLSTWEPRITLRGVSVTPGEDPSLVYISIAYVLVRDGRPGNFVYPFYLE